MILNVSWLHCGSKSHVHVNVMMSSVQIKCNQNSHKHAGEHTLQLVLTATVKESWPAKCTARQHASVSYSDSTQSSLWYHSSLWKSHKDHLTSPVKTAMSELLIQLLSQTLSALFTHDPQHLPTPTHWRKTQSSVYDPGQSGTFSHENPPLLTLLCCLPKFTAQKCLYGSGKYRHRRICKLQWNGKWTGLHSANC